MFVVVVVGVVVGGDAGAFVGEGIVGVVIRVVGVILGIVGVFGVGALIRVAVVVGGDAGAFVGEGIDGAKSRNLLHRRARHISNFLLLVW